jgi:hypothetical protein
MSEQQQMMNALGDMEQALQDLGAAYAAYQGAMRAVSRAAHPSANRQRTPGTVDDIAQVLQSKIRLHVPR